MTIFRCIDQNCSNGFFKRETTEFETCNEINFIRKMIDSKSGGDEKSINENTINNIKANTQWIDVTSYIY
jgi:hypothetical protein